MADIKFSEFQKATISKDSDEIAILQDGVNKMIASPVLESKIINKTVSRVIDQGGASLNLINPIGVVPTYADLALITPTHELNDAYQVEADGLVYVYTENGFQADGEGFKVQPEVNGVVEEGNTQAVSGGEVYEKLSKIKIPDWEPKTYHSESQVIWIGQIWINSSETTELDIPGDSNKWEPLLDKVDNKHFSQVVNYISGSVTDLNIAPELLIGFGINESGILVSASTSYYATVKFYPCMGGDTIEQHGIVPGSRGISFYRSDNESSFISYERLTQDINIIPIPEDANFYRTCVAEDNVKNFEIIIRNALFDSTAHLQKTIDKRFETIGLTTIPEGTNFLQALADSDITDSSIWGQGRIRADGTIGGGSTTGWRYSLEYYDIREGNFSAYLEGLGSGYYWLTYDSSYNIVTAFAREPDSPYVTDFNFSPNERYIRVCVYPESADFDLSRLSLYNTEEIINYTPSGGGDLDEYLTTEGSIWN